MKIIIAGASGLLGSKLVSFFEKNGDEVFLLVRKITSEISDHASKKYFWDPEQGLLNPILLEGIDVVINLAGENITTGRWTESKKKRILKSRLQTTQTLSEAISCLKKPPKVWLNASAVGIYGDRGDEILTEESECGKGFLAEVCRDWEAKVKASEATRMIRLRTGIVLDSEEGMLKALRFPFKLGLGASIGQGQQYMSWITSEDFVLAVSHLILKDISGCVNMTAPHPVTNAHFTKALGIALNRVTFLSMPALLAKILFGEMAKELLLSSARAFPRKLEQSGFVFKYPKIESALQSLLKKYE